MLDLPNDSGGRIGGWTVVDSVYVTQDNQCLRIHHGSDQPGKFVIVREHKLADRNRIILIDDGDDAVFEHHRHAVLLIQIMAAGTEVLFGSQHLTYCNAVFTEKFVVAVY